MKTAVNNQCILKFVLLAICFFILRSISGIICIIGNFLWDIIGSIYRIIIGLMGFILSIIAFFGFILWLFTL